MQFVNATLRLDVTPHVTAEGTVLLDINVQKREPQLAFAVVGRHRAPIATQEARTRVHRARRRHGGDRRHLRGVDRPVPGPRAGLANIPILGHLFKNNNRSQHATKSC